jgi:hypothetical protein
MNFKSLQRRAKQLIDRRGGTDVPSGSTRGRPGPKNRDPVTTEAPLGAASELREDPTTIAGMARIVIGGPVHRVLDSIRLARRGSAAGALERRDPRDPQLTG